MFPLAYKHAPPYLVTQNPHHSRHQLSLQPTCLHTQMVCLNAGHVFTSECTIDECILCSKPCASSRTPCVPFYQHALLHLPSASPALFSCCNPVYRILCHLAIVPSPSQTLYYLSLAALPPFSLHFSRRRFQSQLRHAPHCPPCTDTSATAAYRTSTCLLYTCCCYCTKQKHTGC